MSGGELSTCAEHGLKYDSRQHQGCVVCRRQRNKPEGARLSKRGRLTVLAAALSTVTIAAAALVIHLQGPAEPDEGDSSGPEPSSGEQGSSSNPRALVVRPEPPDARCEEARASGAHHANDCYQKKAKRTLSAGHCDHIGGAFDRGPTRGDCLDAVARALGSAALCKMVAPKPAASDCLEIVATNLEMVSTCGEIEDLSKRAHCVASVVRVTGKGELCKELPAGIDRDACLSDFVSRRGDAALCELFEGTEGKQECWRAAAQVDDPTLCQRVPADERAPCLKSVSDRIEDLGAACGGSDRCLIEVAEKDVTVCDRLSEQATSNQLRACVSKSRGDDAASEADACERLTRRDAKDLCFAELAAHDRFRDSCSKIEDGALRRACLASTAREDPRRCLSLPGPERQSCVSAVVGFLNDPRFCAFLPGNSRSSCERQASDRLAREVRGAR